MFNWKENRIIHYVYIALINRASVWSYCARCNRWLQHTVTTALTEGKTIDTWANRVVATRWIFDSLPFGDNTFKRRSENENRSKTMGNYYKPRWVACIVIATCVSCMVLISSHPALDLPFILLMLLWPTDQQDFHSNFVPFEEQKPSKIGAFWFVNVRMRSAHESNYGFPWNIAFIKLIWVKFSV